MKRNRLTLLAAVLICSLQISAAAAPVPDEVIYQNLDGHQMAIRTYTLLPDEDPSVLREPPFEHDGCRYEFSDLVKEENRFREQDTHTETVTVKTGSRDLKEILAGLEPTMDYDDGTWSGTLALDHSTLSTEAAGYEKKSRTVTETRTLTGLERNDSSLIAPTVTKDGCTLSLSNVAWSVESTALAGNELVPATYSAAATYTGTASYRVATGYVTTAEYKGTVTSSGVSSIRYTATYLGTEIAPEQTGPDEGTIRMITGILTISAVFLIFLLLYLLLIRTDTMVYSETEREGEFERCGRLRLRRGELKLDRLKKMPEGRIAICIEASGARKVFGKTIRITAGEDVFTHTVGHAEGDYWFRLDLSSQEEAEEGAQ